MPLLGRNGLVRVPVKAVVTGGSSYNLPTTGRREMETTHLDCADETVAG